MMEFARRFMAAQRVLVVDIRLRGVDTRCAGASLVHQAYTFVFLLVLVERSSPSCSHVVSHNIFQRSATVKVVR